MPGFRTPNGPRQAEIVAAHALLSRSEAARDVPRDDPGARTDHETALRLAAQALDRLVGVGAPAADADLALRKSYANLEKWRHSELPEARIVGLTFSPGGRYLARYQSDGVLVLRDTQGGADGPACRRDSNSDESDAAVTAAADGSRVALALLTRGDDGKFNALEVWDVPTCGRLLREPLPPYSELNLSRDGRMLAISRRGACGSGTSIPVP